MALLAVEALSLEFPTRRGVLKALEGVSLTIDAGEVLGVVGESGAGKSLTGAAIIGLIEPPGRISGGRILLEGRRIDRLDHEAMRRIRGREIGAGGWRGSLPSRSGRSGCCARARRSRCASASF